MSDGPHQRLCWDCGNVAEHKDSITPWVLCGKCGSQNTRRVNLLEPQKYPEYQVPAAEPTPARWRVLSVEWMPSSDDMPERTAVIVQGIIEPVRNGDSIIYVRAE